MVIPSMNQHVSVLLRFAYESSSLFVFIHGFVSPLQQIFVGKIFQR